MDVPGGVTDLPDDFDGQVRLFPLPGLVLFPHAMQPLHIFEPRYVEMLRESLAGDELIAMATLDSAENSIGQTPISPIVCIGRILSHAELDGDRHNVLLVGLRRAKIRRELETGRSFRMAQVDLIDDFYLPAATSKRDELKQRLLQAFGEIIPNTSGSQQSLHDLMEGQMGVGPITDIISYTLPFPAETKLRLLEVPDVDARAEALIQLIQSGAVQLGSHGETDSGGQAPSTDRAPFPPPFSVN
ncbi:MAG: LON peptidase substrate-binding domain-containing protein [Planctomycetota bacterium]